jgi:SAM-dependent methyltransferase
MSYWNPVFKNKGKIFTEIRSEIPEVLKFFKKRKVRKILDLGCGSGRHTVYFAKKGFDVCGFDISDEGVKLARSWLKKEKLKADLRVGSIYRKLPYPDNFFDAVISTQVIHHARIKNIRNAISEVERVLKPHGLLFIVVRKRRITDLHQKDKFKIIAPRTYAPIAGWEVGVIHYLFNKKLLRKEFKNFKIFKIWVESHKRHYCLLAQSKKS